MKIYTDRRRSSLHFYRCLRAPSHDHTAFTVLGGGVGRTVSPFDVVWRGLILRGAFALLQKKAIFLTNIEVLEVVPKSARLNTSLDVFAARKLLELARVSALI